MKVPVTAQYGGGAAAYLREEILTNSPTRLVSRVLAAAIAACERARTLAAADTHVEWRKQISRAHGCVAELFGAVDREQGGEIATRLAALYQFVLTRLLVAGSRPDAQRPADAARILGRIKEGFDELLAREDGDATRS